MRDTSGRELHAFVEELMDFLRTAGELDLVDRLAHANRFAGFSRAEHLNEVELALRQVLVHRPAALSAEREREIQAVTDQIVDAFRAGHDP
jgi:hypothetical protein